MTTTPRSATLWRVDQFGLVDAACEDILRPLLRTQAYHGRQQPDGTMAVCRRREALYEHEVLFGRPMLMFWFGIAPVVYRALREAGVPVGVRGVLRHPNLPVPIPSERLPDRRLIEYVAHQDRGLIRYDPDRVSVIHLVAQIARAWPYRRITVVVSGRSDTIRYAQQLRTAGIDTYGFSARNQPSVETRVAVCTPSGIAYNPIEPARQDIVIVLNIAAMTAKDHRWRLRYVTRARLYAMLRVGQHLSPYEEDLVRHVFGFAELIIPRHGYQMRPIEVVWARSAGRQLRFRPVSDFALKRDGIWHHKERNRQIARLATAFAAGDDEVLGRSLHRFHAPRTAGLPLNVFVLAENIEHALDLARKLPGWSILAGGSVDHRGLSAEQRSIIEQPRSCRDPYMPYGIVTHAGMQHQGMPWGLVDVLIRADGGTNLPDLPMAAQVVRVADRPLMIVDLDDDHAPELRGSALRRQTAYCEIGWLPADVPLTEYRVAQYLAARVRRRKGGRP